MSPEMLFGSAIGIVEPWYIQKIEFERGEDDTILKGGKLDIYIDFRIGSKFKIDDHPELCFVHDTVNRKWRHINFFQHECYLHARVPRIKTPTGKVLMVTVPWAVAGSSFTLLFEALSMLYVKEGMSMSGSGRMQNVDSRIIKRIIDHYVFKAKQEQPLAQTETIGIDEVSYKKGHAYLTIVSDAEKKKVIGIGEGKDKRAVSEAFDEMDDRQFDFQFVKNVTADLSPSYTASIKEELPNTKLIYDRFHLESLLSKSIDTVRKLEQQETDILKKTKYLWLKNNDSLSEKQRIKVHYFSICFPTLGEAYKLKELFKQIYDDANKRGSIDNLKEWIKQALKSKIQPIIQFVNTLQSHWTGIESYFKTQVSNAFAEQVNSEIQLLKRIARGYRNVDNLKTIIYFKLGGLKFDLITH